MSEVNFAEYYGPYALVTGASSGIGLAFAEELARRGLNLVLSARRVERLEELARRLKDDFDTHSVICPADLTSADAPSQILQATQKIDVSLIVSNAGFNMKGAHESKTLSALHKLLMVNCNAALQLSNGFIPRLKALGRGGILFTSSVEGLIGCPYSAAYSSSKAMVVALGEALWGELAQTGVHVLTLCPGATQSEATELRSLKGQAGRELQPATEVVERALDNLANGPTYIPSDRYRDEFARLLEQPRTTALMSMARQMSGLRENDAVVPATGLKSGVPA